MAKIMKAKRSMKVIGTKRKLSKKGLGSALVAELKANSGRKDLSFNEAPKFATATVHQVPITERAGYPVKLIKGSVNPKNWLTKDGKQIQVDFGRAQWLPDDWGQGVKVTKKTTFVKREHGGGGGILPCYVSPDGKTSYYHKYKVELYVGRKLTQQDGLNGQIQLAKLQAGQVVQLARAQIRETGGTCSYIGADSDTSFFKLLTPSERKVLPAATALHFCVISARRASKVEGIRDIFTVQLQFKDAGVVPTWYVDADSVEEYRALGLKAVVGGKLTQARNKALEDAAKLGKACVQISDDISAWEYRQGPKAKDRTDDAANAACAAADRYIVTPVAAARFILAKMRGAEGKQPQLGGVYPLGSCARTFGSDPFARNHFIIGDFFVADKSKVRFDVNMKLKEDYDFTCAHIAAHGSVMRCQRMTMNVKHYANNGGACTNRDKKGMEERRNVAILKKKWPGMFRDNPKRNNEVIMRWKRSGDDDAEDDVDEVDEAVASKKSAKKSAMKVAKVKKTTFKSSRKIRLK